VELEYCTLFGGEAMESSLKTLLYENEIYFLGVTRSQENIVTPAAFQEELLDNGVDYLWKTYIGKMDANNNLVRCTYFGNYASITPEGLHIHNGKLILAGWTRSTSEFPAEMQPPISTNNAYQSENAGEADVFIAVFASFTGVQILENKNEINLFPNAANNIINISADFTIDSIKIENKLGQFISETICNQKTFQLDDSLLPQGAYLCTTRLANGSVKTIQWMKM